MASTNTIDLSKLKSTYAIRDKTTGKYYVTPNGKTVWSTIGAAKNAWNAHSYDHNTRKSLKFDRDSKNLEIVQVAYTVTIGSDLDHEIQYLRWFYGAADFGPADGDVRIYMNEDYEKSGGIIPKGYREEDY